MKSNFLKSIAPKAEEKPKEEPQVDELNKENEDSNKENTQQNSDEQTRNEEEQSRKAIEKEKGKQLSFLSLESPVIFKIY